MPNKNKKKDNKGKPIITNKVLLQHIAKLDEKVEAVMDTLVEILNKLNKKDKQ